MKNKIGIKTYVIVLLVLVAFAQGYVAIALDNRMDSYKAGLALVPAALCYSYFLSANAKTLNKRAYSGYIAHVATYLIVNISYWLHAFIYLLTNDGISDKSLALDNGWFGVLICMPLFWGLGLLIHTFGAWMSKGFENVSLK